MTKEDIIDFLNTQQLCVIATLNEHGAPSSATVAFSETPDFQLVIGTAETSRKSQNIQRDGRVAMTITDPVKRQTVQLEGTARLLSKADFEPYAEHHFAKLPFSLPFKDIVGQVNFLITPTFVRFTDISSFPWQKTEFTF